MYNDYYGLKCDPFDKSIREEDSFRSQDFCQMTDRLEYLKQFLGIGVFTACSGMGKSYGLRCRVLQNLLRHPPRQRQGWEAGEVPGDPGTNGNFLCLPAYGVGSELAAYTDVFWNYERLSGLIGPVNAATLATALKYLNTLV